ncbi:MAG: hypothetical protein M3Q62_02815 [Actinomycetota bacterium]|jgi:hypothetical protein|nr:hypothetical protein [Actinomycetota bacterium]
MGVMRDILDSAKPVYWTHTALITLVLLWWGIAYENPLWLQLIPVAVAALGASTVDRSWRGVAVVMSVTLLMYVTYCLRHYGPL